MRMFVPIIAGVMLAGWPAAARSEPHSASSAQHAPPVEATVPIELGSQASQLTAWQLMQLLERGESLLLFDVRTDDEYSVSHLSGAIRIDPSADRHQFIGDLGAAAHHRIIVFYCTSSGRSQTFADGVLHDLVDAGAGNVVVLAGGIIAWSNARLPLVSRAGPTDQVHPHDAETAKSLDRSWLVRYEPR